MINNLIASSLQNKLIVLLATATMAGFGLFAMLNIPIGAVPDVTNNQVQVITTSRNLSTLDVERFLTYPVELEMANLPGLIEIRSISKFGLSVVTLVFEDAIGTYLPRQLIAERLQTAMENIPEGFGTPFMGPISTGLGEIYQYVIEVDSAHADQYSISDLRTIQDWTVKRQLSGIPGVVEVNTWGGHLKQYVVELDPNRLKAMNVSIEEVYTAIERNNGIVGGGYIEKSNQTYYIRSDGLIANLDELKQIVVSNHQGTIIKISDVGEVQIGSATRFGAITANGEGEKVLGQVMMLKDANSNQVINDVKERVAEISVNLPEGVHINGFLERSALIKKTTATIAENLILGCLIVIFVVVLLLGNIRSGLVIASVIPLSLLFALSMMYVFGIDANLMSLGAIDFGIIIDGAVIIVEYIAFQISRNSKELMQLDPINRMKRIDTITFEGTKKLTRSALFGQLIIILVFIPILTLTGYEGKMFRPMAQVFSFALLGTMILGFTYVPVVSSMFFKPREEKRNITSRLFEWLNRAYEPSLLWALGHKRTILGLAVGLLLGSAFIFSRMGGEFIPTLDEGDFVIQPVFRSGTSLSETIALTTKIETILKGFPEVDQVVSRIGAAEVPTDPMSMEESDIIITLKPKKEWVTASSKDELADKFKEALLIIPGIDYEFTQPIEMRFNELITGTRADVAIKIFGEDLEKLNSIALRIKGLIEGVEGASDVVVEKTAGLPEMTVVYNRSKLAVYGLSVDEVNRVISMGFAGYKAGEIFEGEKRFDLMVRYAKEHRSEIQHLRQALVTLPDGRQIPISEVAEVSMTKGPAKVSRDNTHRRVVVGVNVRNRDMESVVKDVQQIINKNIDLPSGYSIDYGGQFENLERARQRLLIAVPVALLLIFTLLHLAFGSFREALMVYTAIPLSAVGGIILLWMRGLPFSISAGIGFIALFGIAVLNGIVLIEHFKELGKNGVGDLQAMIIKGTKERLRPVLLTASAAALGFLPMAISTSAGAEVQRPLATVVIGGLITATLLTLIVLPVLYFLFESRSRKKALRANGKITMLVLMLFGVGTITQAQSLTMDQAIEKAFANNQMLRAAELETQADKLLIRQAFDPEKTRVYYNFDENNLAENDLPLKVWGVEQSFSFPGLYFAQHKQARLAYQKALLRLELVKNDLRREVGIHYQNLLYYAKLKDQITRLDSSLTAFAIAQEKNFTAGGSNKLELLTAQSRQQQNRLLLKEVQNNYQEALLQLQSAMQTQEDFTVDADNFAPLALDTGFQAWEVVRQWSQIDESLLQQNLKVEKLKVYPDLSLGYFLGTNNAIDNKRYNGFEVGLALPLWLPSKQAGIRSHKLQTEALQNSREHQLLLLKSRFTGLKLAFESAQLRWQYYQNQGNALQVELKKTADKAFALGEINSMSYFLLLDQIIKSEIDALDALRDYNLLVININSFGLE